jgi:hypothetical protein
MTSELLGLGLIDKADVQNENPIGLLIKIFHARDIASMGWTRTITALTEPMKPIWYSQLSLEFIFLPKDSDSSKKIILFKAANPST